MSARDKLNFVKDGVSKLPPGFQFEPTDEEIVFQYLAPKIFSYPLPALVIPEISIGKFDPWELPGDFDQDRYIFCNKENGNSTIRVTSGGFWKLATGLDKQITCLKWMPIVGIKRTFIFYKGKNSRANSRTDWLMHEYHIAHVGNTQSTNSQEIGNWILCHIFLNKRNNKSEDTDSSSSSSSSYSDSSVLTEVSSNISSDD
ncbi:NAC domain-containing protein 83-like isoform X1 [Olea europaea var. sylvestris]|uniref:NAC domain-containing protein 68 n=1 Tax=Olea europaea subsp. europaea TaxID=158383 RepID=A0A8S0QPC5_OLEEU|nr:NAC domain-containing protein 83-like isoform X1 [Olea europaea var. sylvestris]CAA2969526.1 NAC domain-containing protein 68 [Olea europaea subsp. europaea]